MARRPWLALVVVLVAGSAATATPSVPRGVVATPAAVRAAAQLPSIDLTHLFNRLTVPLGTVPVID
jgi:hypothetical protein